MFTGKSLLELFSKTIKEKKIASFDALGFAPWDAFADVINAMLGEKGKLIEQWKDEAEKWKSQAAQMKSIWDGDEPSKVIENSINPADYQAKGGKASIPKRPKRDDDGVPIESFSTQECLGRAQIHADAAYDYDPDAVFNLRNSLDYLIELMRRKCGQGTRTINPNKASNDSAFEHARKMAETS